MLAHTNRWYTPRCAFCASGREQLANHVGLQAHSSRHESSRVILLSSLYLQVVVEVYHQLLVSSPADIPAVGNEKLRPLFLAKFRFSCLCGTVHGPVSVLNE